MGRYVPPDLEGTVSGNTLHRRPPPGRSLTKPGVQTVRFEMPYAIWCLSCPRPTIIGQGVRFNAEKRREGSYHSTPIWSFRMRHADCGGALEIRTDPANTAYVVISGARKRDTGDDGPEAARARGQEVIQTDEEREALRKSAFASLERTIEDREALKAATDRIDELQDEAQRRWEDPGARNSALRKAFRVGRKERERQAGVDEALQDRMGLGIELLPAAEEDARRAALVEFGGDEESDLAMRRPLFPAEEAKKAAKDKNGNARGAAVKTKLPPGTPKADILAAKRREGFVSEVVGNTRMARDPFLLDGKADAAAKAPPRIQGVKRKRTTGENEGQPKATQEGGKGAAAQTGTSSFASKGLVAYGSDSE